MRLAEISGKETGDFLYPGHREDQEGDRKKMFKIRHLILNHLYMMFILLLNYYGIKTTWKSDNTQFITHSVLYVKTLTECIAISYHDAEFPLTLTLQTEENMVSS